MRTGALYLIHSRNASRKRSTSSGYLTATMALYVNRDTLELLGNMMPHLCGPSNPAASTVVVHSGMPNSSGAVAISRTASIAEIRQLLTFRWLSVSSLKRRASEVGRGWAVVSVVQIPVCGAWPRLSSLATSESLSWLASGQRSAINLVSRAGGK